MTLSLSLGTLIRYSWLIALFAILPGIAAFLVTSSLPKEYASGSKILVGSLTAADLQEQLGYQQLARVYASLATTPLVLDPVAEALDTGESAEELAQRVTASTVVDESLVIIESTGPTPAAAASLSQAVTDAIVGLATPEGPEQPVGTAAPIQSLALVIQPAVEDDTPSAPSVLFDSLIVASVGLGLGVIVTMLLMANRQDRRQEDWSTLPDSRAYPTGPYSR